jgi:Sulfotransferase domain
VPPERLLVYEVGDGWEPLCRFLGVPVPDEPFPHVNATEAFRAGLRD